MALMQERSREEWQWPALESLLADLKHVVAPLEKVAGIHSYRAADAGHRHRREHSGLQRSEQRAAEAAALSGAGATGFAAPERAGRAGAGRVSQRAAAVGRQCISTFAAHNRSLSVRWACGMPGTASITGLAQPEQVDTAQITGGVLETLNVPALAGQWLTAADQDAARPGAR